MSQYIIQVDFQNLKVTGSLSKKLFRQLVNMSENLAEGGPSARISVQLSARPLNVVNYLESYSLIIIGMNMKNLSAITKNMTGIPSSLLVRLRSTVH